MTNFDKLSIEEWQAIASEHIEKKDGSQYTVIGGIVAGLAVTAATASPLAGLVLAGMIWHHAWEKTQTTNRNEQAINEGLVAHVLEGDRLNQYKKQFGEVETALQIDTALERGFTATYEAEDFADDILASDEALPIAPHQEISDRPKHDKYKAFRDVGAAIIQQAGKPGKSKVVVAPSRTGKTTVLYFLLDELFKNQPQSECYVWQGKGVEPVHPNIKRDHHFGFNLKDIDLGAVDAIWDIYEERQQLLEQGQREFNPACLVITDWQSIHDLLKSQAKDVFKDVISRLLTIVNNGAGLGVTLLLDTQSANINEWGLGSGSIRDNFDIFAIARIGFDENDIPIGDCNCVTKIAQNQNIVAKESDRTRVMQQFTDLQAGMRNGDIVSSVILSTAGIVRIGITPQFERKALQFDVKKK
ncbi:hypothetical protein ACWATR_39055 [Nostoc sp. UIC 10890]